MSRIVELIKTPEWWFSAVFIAIVAGIAVAAVLLSAPFLIKSAGADNPKPPGSILDWTISAFIAVGAVALVLLLFYGMYQNTQKVDLCSRARKKLRDRLAKN